MFKIWIVSILFDLLSSEKSCTARYKSWRKKILQNWAYRVSKEAEFCADLKNVQKSCVWQKGKQILQKNCIFKDLEKFCKKSLFWEKIFGKFSTQEFYTFLKPAQNSASFDTLVAQFGRNFFSTLIRDGAVFLKLKAQIR